jgi:hypothetical protein
LQFAAANRAQGRPTWPAATHLPAPTSAGLSIARPLVACAKQGHVSLREVEVDSSWDSLCDVESIASESLIAVQRVPQEQDSFAIRYATDETRLA